MIRELIINKFFGGLSSFDKIGPEHSGQDMTLDIFQDPSYLTMPRAAVKVSGTTVQQLVVWQVDGSPYDTNKYFYDLAGHIYRETSGGVWSDLRTVSGGAGEGLEIFDDYAYYALGDNLGRYGRLSGTPAFDDDLTSWWAAALSDIRVTGGGTGSTDYSTTASINEGATHRQTFTATHDPLKKITIDVDVVGTGNWTVTVHDAENNPIGALTIANGSMVVGDNAFTFSTPLRLIIGNSYHFHVTTTVADGGVDTNVNTDLEGAEFTAEAGVLIDSEFHPMIVVEDKFIIGNEQYLAVFNQATFEPNKILLDRGFKTRTITKEDEYIVVGAYKGASIDEAEEGRLFYWDTISESWNFSIDTTSIGAPHALTNTGNKLRGIYGNKGGLYEGSRPFRRIHQKTAGLHRDHVLEFYPQALAGMENITLIAAAGNATDGGSANIRKGIYAYGSQEESLPDSFVFLYRMSGGNITNDGLKIGSVKVFGSDVYFSWKDAGGNYGVDKVAIDADAATQESNWVSLWFDNGDEYKDFLPLKLIASFDTLASGETVKCRWFDDADTLVNGDNATEGATEASVSIYSRQKKVRIGVAAASSNGTYPKIRQLKLVYNDLSDEKKML